MCLQSDQADGCVLSPAAPSASEVDGQTLQMLALPAAYIADGLEAWRIMGLRGTGTFFPDIMYLVPREELADATKDFPLRNVHDRRAVCTWLSTCSAPLIHGGCDSHINLML